MAKSIIGNAATVLGVYQALNGQAPSYALYANYLSEVSSTSKLAFTNSLVEGMASTSNATLAATVLANLGVTATTVTASGSYEALLSALTTAFASYGLAARGQIILNAVSLLPNLEGDTTFGTAATAYNTALLSNFTYASVATNTSPGTLTVTDPDTVSNAYSLTAAHESFTGAGAADTFTADVASYFGLDTLSGGGGTDTLNITATTGVEFILSTTSTISSIETLSLTHTADSGAAADDITMNLTGYSSFRTVTVANTGDVATDSSDVTISTKSNVTSIDVNGGASAQDVVAVTISDTGTASSATVAVTDTLATVSITGASSTVTLASDALTTLNLDSVSGLVTNTDAYTADTRALTVNVAAGTITGVTDAGASTLTIITTGAVTALGTFTAAAAKTVNVVANDAITAGTLATTAATALNVSGDSLATMTVGTLAATAAVTITGSAGLKDVAGLGSIASVDGSGTSGAVTLGATTVTAGFGTAVSYAGGAGADTITVGATTKAITTGAGNDTVYILSTVSALGTSGSIDAGDGTSDTLGMTGTDAASASASSTFAGTISNFERLTLDTVTSNTIDLAYLDSISYVTMAGTINGAILSNMPTGGQVNVNTAQTAYTVSVKNASTSTTDSLTLSTSATTGMSVGTVSVAGVETVAFLTDDSTATASQTAAGIAHTYALSDSALTTVTVTGDAGLILTHSSGGTLLNSFSAAGVTHGAVTFTSAALTVAATVVGGAGNDTLNLTSATKNISVDGGTGIDTITGGAGNDIITDTSTTTDTSGVTYGNSLIGGSGNDTITGGVGNDTINGGTGNDSIIAGSGNDSITDASGSNYVDTGDGANTVTLTGSAGNNTVMGGAGSDTIYAGTGNDTISTGNGTNTVSFASGDDITTDDTITGGTGTDTITFVVASTALADADFTHVTSVEKLTATAGQAISVTLGAYAMAAGLTTITGNTAADSVTVGAGFTSALSVALGTDTLANSVIASASAAAITVTATGTALATGVDTLTGGTSSADVLKVTADSTSANLTSTTGFETITIVANGAATLTLLNLGVATGKSVTVDGSALDNELAALTLANASSAGSLIITGGSGNDVINLTNSTSASTNTVVGGAGNDSITGGSGVDNLSGGAGDDTFTVATTGTGFVSMTAVDTISGGAGNDILSFTAGAVTVAAADLLGLSAVETITFLNTTETASITLTDAVYTADGVTSLAIDASTMTTGVLTVAASALTATNSVALTLTSTTNAAANSIVLGKGADTVYLDAIALDSGTITGGTGTDTLSVSANTGGGAITIAAGVTGFEVMSFATAGITGTYNFIANTLTVASGVTFAVNGSNLTGALTWNGAAELNGYYSITGGSGADSLVGGALADTIVGGTGNDTITGGLGADVLYGGTTTANVFNYTGIGFETGTVSPTIIYYGGTVTAGSSLSTSGFDKIMDFQYLDSIVTNVGGSATNGTNGVGLIWSDYSGFLLGAYDSSANTFTFSTTGTDSLFVYDFDGLTTTSSDLRGIVLVGYVDTLANDTMATGLVGVSG